MKVCPQCGFKEKPREKFVEGFADFWKAYPRKAGKWAAEKEWSKIKPDWVLVGEIMVALEAHKKLPGWLKDNGAYIPHASTWLHQRRWEDEEARPKTEAPKYDPQKMAQKEREMAELKERLYRQKNGIGVTSLGEVTDR